MADPWGPGRRRPYELQPEVREIRVDSSGFQIPLQRNQQLKVWDTVMPVMVVDPTAPTQGMSGGPQVRPLVDTSGQVTEANSATIEVDLQWILYSVQAAARPTLKGSLANTSQLAARVPKVAIVPVPEVGGSCAAVDLVPAQGGAYYSVVDSVAIWSPQTDAASDWTLAATSGVTGPAVHTIQLAAQQVTDIQAAVPNVPSVAPFVCHGSADNEAITIAAANLPVVGTTYYAIVVYHYET
jgi:hypothetical protein